MSAIDAEREHGVQNRLSRPARRLQKGLLVSCGNETGV
jgi:hypothetical protein